MLLIILLLCYYNHHQHSHGVCDGDSYTPGQTHESTLDLAGFKESKATLLVASTTNQYLNQIHQHKYGTKEAGIKRTRPLC